MEYSELYAGLHRVDDIQHRLPQHPAIKRLLLHGNALTTLANSLELPALEYLNVSSNSLNELDFKQVSHFPALAHVDAATNRIQQISNICALTNLTALNASFNCINTLDFLSEGAEPNGQNLERLDLRDNCIQDLAQLDNLRHCRKLKTLRLQSVVLSDSGVEHSYANPVCFRHTYLSHVLAQCPQLQMLDDVHVDEWRKHITEYERESLTDETFSEAVEPLAPSPAQQTTVPSGAEPPVTTDVPTPLIDQAERRFVTRLMRKLGGVESSAPQSVIEQQQHAAEAATATSGSMLQQQLATEVPTASVVSESRLALIETTLQRLLSENASHPTAKEIHRSSGEPVADAQGTPARHSSDPPSHADVAHKDDVALSPVVVSDVSSSRLSTTAATLRIENTNLRKNLANITEELSATQLELEKTKAELRIALVHREAEEQATAVGSKARDLMARETEETLKALRADVTEKSEKINALESALADAPSIDAHNRLQQRIAQLEDALLSAPSNTAYANMQAKMSAAMEELVELRNVAQQRLFELNGMASKCSTLEDQLQAAQDGLATVKAELSEQQTLIQELQTQLDREVSLRQHIEEATRISQQQLGNALSEAIGKQKVAEQRHFETSQQLETSLARQKQLEANYAQAEQAQARLHEQLKLVEQDSKQAVLRERQQAAHALTAAEAQMNAIKRAAEEEIKLIANTAKAKTNSMSAALSQAMQRISQLETALATKTSLVSKLEDENSRLHQQLHDETLLNEQLRERAKEREGRIQTATQVSKDFNEGHIADLNMRLADVTAQLRHQQDLVAEQTSALQTSHARITQLQNEVKVKDAMLDDQNDTIATLKRALNASKENAASHEQQHKQVVAELQTQLAELKDRCNELTSYRDDALKEADKARAAANASRRVTAQLEQVVESLRSECSGVEELRAELSAKDAALSFVEQEISQIKAAYEGRIHAVQHDKAVLAQRCEELAERLRQADTAVASINKKYDNANERINVLTAECNEKQHVIDQLQRRLHAADMEMRTLLQQLDATKARNREQLLKMSSVLQQLQESPSIAISVTPTVTAALTDALKT